MRNSFIILLFSFFTNAYAQHINLSGSLPELAGKKIVIQYLDHFKGEIAVDAAGKFSGDVNLEPGYYTLKGTDVTVYLEPDFSLSVSKIGNNIIFDGKGSVENTMLRRIIQLAASYLPLKNNFLTDDINFIEPSVFLDNLGLYKSAALNLVNNAAVSAYFKRSEAEKIEYFGKRLTNEYLARYGVDPVKQQEAYTLQMEFVKNMRLGNNDKAFFEKYKQAMKNSHKKVMSASDSSKLNIFSNFDMNNELAYRCSADYRTLLKQQYVNLENKQFAIDHIVTESIFSYKVLTDNITNPFMRQEMQFQYVLERFSMMNTQQDRNKTYEDYIAHSNNKYYVNDIKTLYLGSKELNGSSSPDFLFTNANGSKTSLTSMRGSYVYIDLWATWCISCIVQLPNLKLLEKKYAGKNIRFVSISIDNKKDEHKWKEFISKYKLRGTQLIAYGNGSKFNNFFKVSGIPRFILIDPNGVVISEDALLPGDADLEKTV